jgi:tetratricopeptide (TPR) repeat protein
VQPTGAATAPAEVPLNPGVLRADSLFEAGKHDLAVAEYKRAIGRNPTDSDTWYALAEAFFELGRTKEGVETYSLALTTIEHAPELRIPFAERLIKAGRKGEAIKVLQRGIEIDPESSEEMKGLLGSVLMGALDAAAQPDAPAGAGAAAGPGRTPAAGKAATASRGSTRTANKKRKKLCNLFCPGTFPVTPKPK